jgi:hypothetical protein
MYLCMLCVCVCVCVCVCNLEHFMRLVEPILKALQEQQHQLGVKGSTLCPADQRIQALILVNSNICFVVNFVNFTCCACASFALHYPVP